MPYCKLSFRSLFESPKYFLNPSACMRNIFEFHSLGATHKCFNQEILSMPTPTYTTFLAFCETFYIPIHKFFFTWKFPAIIMYSTRALINNNLTSSWCRDSRLLILVSPNASLSMRIVSCHVVGGSLLPPLLCLGLLLENHCTSGWWMRGARPPRGWRGAPACKHYHHENLIIVTLCIF